MSLLSSKVQESCGTVLTEVILDALSEAAYRVTLDQPGLLEISLTAESVKLQLGSIHEIHIEKPYNELSVQVPLQFRVLMLEPTSHGRIDASSTKIIIVYSRDPGSLASTTFPSESAESEGIEIDEGFLANAIVPRTLKLNGQTDDARLPTSPGDAHQAPQVMFNAKPLVSPVSLLDDHCTLYIRTVDLGRIGLLNEDWARTRHKNPFGSSSHPTLSQAIASLELGTNYRLVRIVANDRLVKHP